MATRKGICITELCEKQGEAVVLPVQALFRCEKCKKELKEIARYPTGVLPGNGRDSRIDFKADERLDFIPEVQPAKKGLEEIVHYPNGTLPGGDESLGKADERPGFIPEVQPIGKGLEEIAHYPNGALPGSDESPGKADERPDFIPELQPVAPIVALNGKKYWRSLTAAGLFLLVVLLGGVWLVFRNKEEAPSLPSGTQTILRLSGSSTIGSDLAPTLAERFLRSRGAPNVYRVRGAEDEIWVVGTLPGEGASSSIEIKTHLGNTRFEPLGKGECDIVISPRRIKVEEKEALAHLGDMTSHTSENVLALDGIAIIVNDANPLDALTVEQIRNIFTGLIDNWSQVGGLPGEIHLYRPNSESGTFDTFRELVLEGAELSSGADHLGDSAALSKRVAGDAQGIGLVGITSIATNTNTNTKTLKVSTRGSVPVQPTALNVQTEDYLLSRRIYLYTLPASRNLWVSRFVELALSDLGQAIVNDMGFIGQTISQESIAQPEDAVVASDLPLAYERLVRDAERLPLNFRFRSGSAELDAKAYRDLGRLTQFMSDRRYWDSEVLLLGFSDSVLGAESNLELSRRLARAVERQVQGEGLRPVVVDGFGEELPVARNDTEEGRGKNRRVEIWIRETKPHVNRNEYGDRRNENLHKLVGRPQ